MKGKESWVIVLFFSFFLGKFRFEGKGLVVVLSFTLVSFHSCNI